MTTKGIIFVLNNVSMEWQADHAQYRLICAHKSGSRVRRFFVPASVGDPFVNRQFTNLYVRVCYKKEPEAPQ